MVVRVLGDVVDLYSSAPLLSWWRVWGQRAVQGWPLQLTSPGGLQGTQETLKNTVSCHSIMKSHTTVILPVVVPGRKPMLASAPLGVH